MWWRQIPEIAHAYSLNTARQIQFYSVVTLDRQQPSLKSHVFPGCLRNNLAHRWQTGWHLCSQWCWALKGVTFHRKTSVPADPRLALVRGTFTHHAAGISHLHQHLNPATAEAQLIHVIGPLTWTQNTSTGGICLLTEVCRMPSESQNTCHHASLYFS